VAFLRITRDRRGYENTFLLHASRPNDFPRVLYWFRSAPGVRVGRAALDEDAIRTIEEQHPEIEFDWPQILEVGAASAPEVDDRPVRPRRKPPQPKRREDVHVETDVAAAGTTAVDDNDAPDAEDAVVEASADNAREDAAPTDAEPPSRVAPSLLDQLVGREIATRLRGRYAETCTRIRQRAPDDLTRELWLTRASALNPDSWVTPEEILKGVSRADELFDGLRRELLS
jgi:hypothetical protein